MALWVLSFISEAPHTPAPWIVSSNRLHAVAMLKSMARGRAVMNSTPVKLDPVGTRLAAAGGEWRSALTLSQRPEVALEREEDPWVTCHTPTYSCLTSSTLVAACCKLTEPQFTVRMFAMLALPPAPCIA
jgi:hypothetical protein